MVKPSATDLATDAISSNKVVKRNQIVEATGWIVDKDGNIEFVAQANPINPNFRQTPVSYSASK